MKLKFVLFSLLVCSYSIAQEFLYFNKSSQEKIAKDYVSVIGSSETFSSGLNFNLLTSLKGAEKNFFPKVSLFYLFVRTV